MGEKITDLSDFVVAVSEARAAMGLVRGKGLSALSLQTVLRHQVPHPNGGFLYIGPVAADALMRVAKRALVSYPELVARAHSVALDRAIFREFGKYLADECEALTSELASRIVNDAVSSVRASLEASVTHFLPCVLSQASTLSRFEVGPVVFQTAATFFDEAERQPDKSDWKEGWEEAKAVILSHGWVASVVVEHFDKERSSEIAADCIETALNIIRLFVGGHHAGRFRLGGGYRLAERGARIVRKSNGHLSPELSRKRESASLPESWVEQCLGGEAKSLVSLAGNLINGLRSGEKIPALYRRLLVALWWYGEGVAEPHDHAKAVRFAIAMEAFLGTPANPDARCVTCGKVEGIVEQVARRAGHLCGYGSPEVAAKWVREVRDFYNARSRLVHGDWAPYDAKVRKFALMGERLCRSVLLEGLSWSHYVALQDLRVPPSEIGRYFDEVLPKWSPKEAPAPTGA
jgi:hypothetical protein